MTQIIQNTHAELLKAARDGGDNNYLGFSFNPSSEPTSSSSPVCVDIVVKDSNLEPLLADVGVSILYYCKRCAFSSTVLLDVTDHMRSCGREHVTDCLIEKPTIVKCDHGDGSNEANSGLSNLTSAAVEVKTGVKRKRGRPRKVVAQTTVVKAEPVNDGAINTDEDNDLTMTPLFCPRCPSTSLHSDVELSHHVKCHCDDGELRCHICADDRPRRWPYLKDHLNLVHAVHFDICCSECDVRYASHAEFRSHVHAEHSFPCPHCNYIALNNAHAKTHLRCHDPRDPTRLRCYVCDTEMAKWFSLHCHLVANHPGEISALYTCAKCSRGFQYSQMLRKHVLKCGENDKLRCTVCDARVHPKGMAAHMRTHDQPPVTNNGTDTTVRCSHCYKKFADDARLQLHLQYVHAPERMLPVLCDQCGKSFVNAIRLRNHVREVHECVRRRKRRTSATPSVHVCEICAYVTPDRLRLRNHQLSAHAGVHPYVCDQCDYCTNERSDARRHRLRHLGVKKFACSLCDYRTNARWLLAKHCQRRHAVIMPPWQRKTTAVPVSQTGTAVNGFAVCNDLNVNECADNERYCKTESGHVDLVDVTKVKIENNAAL